jgi:hypothetical protein
MKEWTSHTYEFVVIHFITIMNPNLNLTSNYKWKYKIENEREHFMEPVVPLVNKWQGKE